MPTKTHKVLFHFLRITVAIQFYFIATFIYNFLVEIIFLFNYFST